VRRATAVAHANIALVKYWGKRDEALLLPESPSLSIALDRLFTTTTVELGVPSDSLVLDGRAAGEGELRRARFLLDAAGIGEGARIESRQRLRGSRGGSLRCGRAEAHLPGAVRARPARVGFGGA